MTSLKKLTAVLCAAALFAVSGCGSAAGKTDTSEVSATGSETSGASAAETTGPTVTEQQENAPAQVPEAADIVSDMTLEQKISQMIMISYRYWSDPPAAQGEDAVTADTTALNDKQKALISKYEFGGICLFKNNLKDTEQTVKLTCDIQAAAAESKHAVPLLIATDQEGGEVARLTTGTRTCGNMALGAVRDPQAVRGNAVIIGSELHALGLNTDLGPVLDVNNNPSNPVINVRSFSSDPQLTSEFGRAYIDGLEEEGIISTVKHFPGHGDTDTDSHTGLPMIDKPLEELEKVELLPFADAVGSADMVMTAHIQFPQIETSTYTSPETGEDITLPATLSEKVISGILRGEMGYDGVVVTDDMLMDAIQKHFDPIDAAVLAINADVDLILDPLIVTDDESIAALEEYISSLADAVRDGRIDEAEIDDSVTRIISLKLRKGLFGSAVTDAASAAAEAKKIVGSEEYHRKELEIAERAITLIKNDDNTLPLRLEDGQKVCYFYPYSGGDNAMGFVLEKLKKEGVIPADITAECHSFTEKSASDDREGLVNDAAGYADIIKGSAAVIIATETYRRENMDSTSGRGWQAAFTDRIIAAAKENGVKTIHLSMHMPYDAVRYTDADAVICAYCGQDMPEIPKEYNGDTKAYGVNYPAALITVFGGSAPSGKLPVDLPAFVEGQGFTDVIMYPFGYGLSYGQNID